MLATKISVFSGLILLSVGCANFDFKGSSPQPKSSPATNAAVGEGTGELSTMSTQTVESTVADEPDTTSEELSRLIASSGEDVKRTTGDMGIKAGCIPTQKMVTSTVQVPPTSGVLGLPMRRGWSGGAMPMMTPTPTTTKITNRVVEVGSCVADRLKTERFAFCQLKTASVELVECMNWSSVAGSGKKSSEDECKKQADESSKIKTDSMGRRSLPSGMFFFVCQKL